MHVREENEKRRATLKGGVQGRRRMSRAAPTSKTSTRKEKRHRHKT